jgi:hypothetical protein
LEVDEMLEGIRNRYLESVVKQRVNRFYIEMGINPKDLEKLTMREILEKVEYAMKNLIGWREEYYKTLDTIATQNGEIAHVNATFKELEKKFDALKTENIKLRMKNDFLTQECKTFQIANNRRILDNAKEKSKENVVSYERG